MSLVVLWIGFLQYFSLILVIMFLVLFSMCYVINMEGWIGDRNPGINGMNALWRSPGMNAI